MSITESDERSALAQHTERALAAWNLREAGILELQVLLARGIEHSADYADGRRAYPSPGGSRHSGVGLAHGSAGILHALHVAGLEIDPLALAWHQEAVAAAPPTPGLFDGAAGTAWVFRRLGDHDRANAQVAILDQADLRMLPSDLADGLAGIGLVLLAEQNHRATPSDHLTARLGELFGILDARSRQWDPGKEPAVGLARGVTGVGLLAARLHAVSGDREHLDLAVRAARLALGSAVIGSAGALLLPTPRPRETRLPGGPRPKSATLGDGSAGLALLLAELLHPDTAPLIDPGEARAWRAALDGIELAIDKARPTTPGLLDGRVGLVHVAAELSHRGLGTDRALRAVVRHTTALSAWVRRDGIGLLVDPGIATGTADPTARSADLATGAAGVLTALEAYQPALDGRRSRDTEDLIPLLFSRPATSRR